MVQLEIIFEILPHKKMEFTQAVKDLCDHNLNQKKGTHLCIYKALIEENLYCYLEQWESRQNLDAHIQTERFEMLIGAMKVLGEIRHSQIHDITKIEELEI